MARNHWRFVVRDAYGYAIQNARVDVFLPGTTTVFSGTAYDDPDAGDAVTNPFTTNDQGEVEAWFDTPQRVDVRVGDNTDAAYRAVEGSSQTISFTTFTEESEVHESPGNDVSVLGHGADDHANITRSFFLPVLDVVNDGGTVATRGTQPAAFRVITLADGADTGCSWAFPVPADWASGALTIEIFHAGQTTAAGNVVWSLQTQAVAEGESIVGAGTTVGFTGADVATADLLIIEAAQTGETPAAAGDLYRVSVRRNGDDASDDYAASTSLIGIRVNYTATQ